MGKKLPCSITKKKKFIACSHDYEISMQHQNYQIWVESIVPNWNVPMDRSKNKILVFNHKRFVEFFNMVDDLEPGLRAVGFTAKNIINIQHAMRLYSDPVKHYAYLAYSQF